MPKIAKLQYITQNVDRLSHAELAELACACGVGWVQLRVKNTDFEQWLQIAKETQAVCIKYNAVLIINDNVEIAKIINADGVHLGKNDMSPVEARKILGNDFIIGGTANSEEDVRNLINSEVDYIGLGPFRFTKTKENLSPVLGLTGIQKIISNTNPRVPVIAIGGIQTSDVEELLDNGVNGIAVSSAINLAENISDSATKFINTISKYKTLVS